VPDFDQRQREPAKRTARRQDWIEQNDPDCITGKLPSPE
jgi:hypothetical protein